MQMVSVNYAIAEYNYSLISPVDEMLLKLEKLKLRFADKQSLPLQVNAYLTTLQTTTDKPLNNPPTYTR